MRTPQFWLYAVLLFFYGFSFFSVQLHLAAYVTDLGISATNAAVVLTVMGGAIVCGQIGLGSAGDKIGYKRAFLLGAVLLSLGIFVLIFARELWTFYISAVLLGLAFGNCSTQESPLTAWLFGIGSHGHLFGFFVFCCTVGCGAGPVVSGFIFDRTGSYQFAFWLSAGISVALIIMTTFLKSPTAVPTSRTGYVETVGAQPGRTSLPS